MAVITLLTDFGTKDPYVGIMKGVILSIADDATIIDISHEVGPQNTRECAFLVPEYYRYFERGSVHVAVVDPMVGSSRRPVAVMKDGHVFVGPDNGIFSFLLTQPFETYAIQNSRFMLSNVSSTFHGRDIFAPVAAHVAKGFHPSSLGDPVSDPVVLGDLRPIVREGVLWGEVIRFDHFGNAITNIGKETLEIFAGEKQIEILLGDLVFSDLNEAYYERETSCLIGSNGYLEFALFRGSLQHEYGLKKGEKIQVSRR